MNNENPQLNEQRRLLIERLRQKSSGAGSGEASSSRQGGPGAWQSPSGWAGQGPFSGPGSAHGAWEAWRSEWPGAKVGQLMYWLTTMFPGITSWAPPGMDLGAMPTAREYTPIVPMKPTGSRPPFFLVHGGFGSVFPYHHLSVHMGEDQPLYGLQARGLDGREAPLDSIPDMAASYAEAIQATCPQGPYHLGGYSFGGWVAYEIAQILARSGGEVGLLAFFGIGAPFSVIGGPMVEQLSYWSQFFEDAFNLARQKGKMGLGGLGQHPPELREMLPPMWRVLFAALKAQSRYFPEPWPGSAELFFTREQEPAFRWFPALGWERLCGDVVGRHPVPGTHLKMFQESNVQIVARELTQLLEERS